MSPTCRKMSPRKKFKKKIQEKIFVTNILKWTSSLSHQHNDVTNITVTESIPKSLETVPEKTEKLNPLYFESSVRFVQPWSYRNFRLIVCNIFARTSLMVSCYIFSCFDCENENTKFYENWPHFSNIFSLMKKWLIRSDAHSRPISVLYDGCKSQMKFNTWMNQ